MGNRYRPVYSAKLTPTDIPHRMGPAGNTFLKIGRREYLVLIEWVADKQDLEFRRRKMISDLRGLEETQTYKIINYEAQAHLAPPVALGIRIEDKVTIELEDYRVSSK